MTNNVTAGASAPVRRCPRDGTTDRSANGGKECRACVRRRQREWKRRKYATDSAYRLREAMQKTLYNARKQVERADDLRRKLNAEL